MSNETNNLKAKELACLRKIITQELGCSQPSPDVIHFKGDVGRFEELLKNRGKLNEDEEAELKTLLDQAVSYIPQENFLFGKHCGTARLFEFEGDIAPEIFCQRIEEMGWIPASKRHLFPVKRAFASRKKSLCQDGWIIAPDTLLGIVSGGDQGIEELVGGFDCQGDADPSFHTINDLKRKPKIYYLGVKF